MEKIIQNINVIQTPQLTSIPLCWFQKNSVEWVACMLETRGQTQCLGLYVHTLQPDGRWTPNNKGLSMEVGTWQTNLPVVMQIAQSTINTARP